MKLVLAATFALTAVLAAPAARAAAPDPGGTRSPGSLIDTDDNVLLPRRLGVQTEFWVRKPELEGAAVSVGTIDRFAMYIENAVGRERKHPDAVAGYYSTVGAGSGGRNIGLIALAANNPKGNIGLFAGAQYSPGSEIKVSPIVAAEMWGSDAVSSLILAPDRLDARSGTAGPNKKRIEKFSFAVDGKSFVSVSGKSLFLGGFELYEEGGSLLLKSPSGKVRVVARDEGVASPQ